MLGVVLLVGNPNAGKSTLFNRLAHGHAHVGNWHGVTVDALEKQAVIGGRPCTLVDLPGIYTTEGRSMEEKFAARYVAERPSAAIVFVAECAGLSRTVPLMHALTAGRRKCMLVLTKRRRFEREGGRLDPDGLRRCLGIPVLFAEDDVASAVGKLLDGPLREVPLADMGGLVSLPSEQLGRFDRFLLNGFFGLFFFVALLLAVFFVTFLSGMPGDLLKTLVEEFFTVTLAGYAAAIPSPVVRSLVSDGILMSLGSVLSFLPQIALLHFFLIVLEESGLMSRLAVLTDGLLSRIGLSGRAVFSLLMGFGCTAVAVTTTKGLDDKRMQRRVILCLPYLSCSAKLPVYLTLSASFFENAFAAALLLYGAGVWLALIAALYLKEKTPPLVMELAPLQFPAPLFTLKSLLFQIKQFIIKVATVVLAFFLFSWLLSSFDPSFALCTVENSMLARICRPLGCLFAPVGMGDWRIAYAAISGLIAKENVAGAIAMFYGAFPYPPASAFAFSVFMLTCSPCVSAIAATARELGAGRALLYAAAQTLSALLACYLVYFLLTGSVAVTLPALLFCFTAFYGIHEKVHRHDRHHAQRIYRDRLRTGGARASRALKGPRSARQRRKGGRGLPLAPGR